MNDTIERAAVAMAAKWMENAPRGSSPDMPYWRDMARIAIKAARSFNTEDFTLTEAAGIRRLIDEALED